MDRLCVIFTLVLLPTFVSTVSRLQTFCTQRSGQWFNTSQTCVFLSSETYSWNDGWDYCSSYVDTADENDTIKGRLAHLISESELFSLRSMSFTVGSPTIYLGAGAFVRGSRNIDDWNWCDTKACGRDGGQAKHPITIDLSGVYIDDGDKNCGEIEENNRGLNVDCDGPAEVVACQYFMAQSQDIETSTSSTRQTTSTTTSLPRTTSTTNTPSPTTSTTDSLPKPTSTTASSSLTTPTVLSPRPTTSATASPSSTTSTTGSQPQTTTTTRSLPQTTSTTYTPRPTTSTTGPLPGTTLTTASPSSTTLTTGSQLQTTSTTASSGPTISTAGSPPQTKSTTASPSPTTLTTSSLPKSSSTISSPSQTTSLGQPPAHYVKQSSGPTRFVLHQYMNVSIPRQCAHYCFNYAGCTGYVYSTTDICSLLGAIDSSNRSTIAGAFINKFL